MRQEDSDFNNMLEDGEFEESLYEPHQEIITYLCEDCDYRWEIEVEMDENNIVEENSFTDECCPMCGSTNTIQLQ